MAGNALCVDVLGSGSCGNRLQKSPGASNATVSEVVRKASGSAKAALKRAGSKVKSAYKALRSSDRAAKPREDTPLGKSLDAVSADDCSKEDSDYLVEDWCFTEPTGGRDCVG